MPTSRRELLGRMASLLPTYGVLQYVFHRDLFSAPYKAEGDRWLARVHDASRDLIGHRLTPLQWQTEVESLFGGVGLAELVRLVDFGRLSRQVKRPVDRAGARAVTLPEVDGLPRRPAFGTKVFALRKGVAIVPHGHRNMVSMHVVLRGEFHLRHYDRLQDEPEHLILQPTIDRVARPGDLSSISSQKDNVHWFRALEDAFTLDVVVDNLDPTLGFRYEMDFVDPARGEPVGDGRIRSRRLSFEQALALYGPRVSL